MAIGNAPWPIGVTMVGIHARTGREKISARNVAHVLNDETQRKYIQVRPSLSLLVMTKLKDGALKNVLSVFQAVKRLITHCQKFFPTDPSRCVDYEAQGVGVALWNTSSFSCANVSAADWVWQSCTVIPHHADRPLLSECPHIMVLDPIPRHLWGGQVRLTCGHLLVHIYLYHAFMILFSSWVFIIHHLKNYHVGGMTVMPLLFGCFKLMCINNACNSINNWWHMPYFIIHLLYHSFKMPWFPSLNPRLLSTFLACSARTVLIHHFYYLHLYVE